MSDNNGWSTHVTPELKEDIENTAYSAYKNGVSIREDAILLFQSRRYPRATALAILSEEEFSKAFILKICAEQARWDSNIYKALRKHSDKQGISEALREYYNWFIDNYTRVLKRNKFSLVQTKPAALPTKEHVEQLLAIAKSTTKNPKKDNLKQDSIYVGIDKSAKTSSLPVDIGETEAKQALDDSFSSQVIIEVLFGNSSNLDSSISS